MTASLNSSRPHRAAFLKGFRLFALTALLGTSALLATQAARAEPVRGGTLNYVLDRESATILPINTTQYAAMVVGPKIFDGLLAYEKDFTPIPQLATAWEVAPDFLQYRFTIREGVRWHDGKPLTADDVAFSLQRLKEFHPRGRSTFGNVTSIETPDAQTVVLRLSRPAPYLLTALAASESPIIPRHVFESIAGNENPPHEALIGSGPFRFREWVRGGHIILGRNDEYWQQGKPYLDQIIVHIVPDAAARTAGFEAGKFDLGFDGAVPLTEVERLKQVPHLALEDVPPAYLASHREIFFNFETPQLQDVRVRRAIAHAIDLKALHKLIYLGYGQYAFSPISPALVQFHDASIRPYAHDLKEANRLLDEAGFARGSNGERFRLRLLNNPAADPRHAAFIRQSLKPIGIEVDVSLTDQATYVRQVYTDRAFDLAVEALSNMFDPAVGVHRGFLTSAFKVGLPFSNPARYSNPEVDRILTAAGTETDLAKRQQLYRDFQRIVHEELPSIDIAYPAAFVVKKKTVQGELLGAHAVVWSFADTYLSQPGR